MHCEYFSRNKVTTRLAKKNNRHCAFRVHSYITYYLIIVTLVFLINTFLATLLLPFKHLTQFLQNHGLPAGSGGACCQGNRSDRGYLPPFGENCWGNQTLWEGKRRWKRQEIKLELGTVSWQTVFIVVVLYISIQREGVRAEQPVGRRRQVKRKHSAQPAWRQQSWSWPPEAVQQLWDTHSTGTYLNDYFPLPLLLSIIQAYGPWKTSSQFLPVSGSLSIVY